LFRRHNLFRTSFIIDAVTSTLGTSRVLFTVQLSSRALLRRSCFRKIAFEQSSSLAFLCRSSLWGFVIGGRLASGAPPRLLIRSIVNARYLINLALDVGTIVSQFLIRRKLGPRPPAWRNLPLRLFIIDAVASLPGRRISPPLLVFIRRSPYWAFPRRSSLWGFVIGGRLASGAPPRLLIRSIVIPRSLINTILS
jgi:hypothetical protein